MSLDEICWYHPKIKREEGEKKILDDPRQIKGLFIVRDSFSSQGDYVLSVLCEDDVHHYQIRKHQQDSIFSINESVKIHGLENLIEYYKTHPLSEDGLVLTEFIKGVQPPPETKRSGNANLLHRATIAGNYSVVSEILHSPYTQSDAKNQNGQTATHLAAIDGQNDILKLLIENQVNVNLRDAMGFTPLHYACEYNHPESVKILITLGKADIQARNTESGEVPLHVAAREGHLEVINVLLSFNAPLNPRTMNGCLVPAQLARRRGHRECAEFLESYRCPTPQISQKVFYHGTLDRQESEEKIMKFKLEAGVYLVRYSERNNANILTLYYEKVRHYMIKTQDSYLFIDDGPLLNSLEHLVEYYSRLPDGLPTVLTDPVPPPRKPDAPPIATLKRCKLKSVKPKISIPPEPAKESIPTSQMFQDRAFVSDMSLANNNNNNDNEQEYVIHPERLVRGDLIGKGEFASVFEGVYTNNQGHKIKVAIKTLRNEHSETNKENFRREAQVMQNLRHDYIVKSLGICEGPPLQMIQELVPLGSILQYIHSHSNEINPNFEFRKWAVQIACGMHYLEENRFVHRDLAARNILLFSKNQVKISDFGLSRTLDLENMYKAAQGGRWPLKWYAPESYLRGHFDHKSDVWSYGVTIWEIYSYGETPYGDMKGSEAIQLIDKGIRLKKPNACPDYIYQKMLQCWEYKKEDRPTFKELTDFFNSGPEYANNEAQIG